jgi:hypothetical protein
MMAFISSMQHPVGVDSPQFHLLPQLPFKSPISPTKLIRQSLPFADFSIEHVNFRTTSRPSSYQLLCSKPTFDIIGHQLLLNKLGNHDLITLSSTNSNPFSINQIDMDSPTSPTTAFPILLPVILPALFALRVYRWIQDMSTFTRAYNTEKQTRPTTASSTADEALGNQGLSLLELIPLAVACLFCILFDIFTKLGNPDCHISTPGTNPKSGAKIQEPIAAIEDAAELKSATEPVNSTSIQQVPIKEVTAEENLIERYTVLEGIDELAAQGEAKADSTEGLPVQKNNTAQVPVEGECEDDGVVEEKSIPADVSTLNNDDTKPQNEAESIDDDEEEDSDYEEDSDSEFNPYEYDSQYESEAEDEVPAQHNPSSMSDAEEAETVPNPFGESTNPWPPAPRVDPDPFSASCIPQFVLKAVETAQAEQQQQQVVKESAVEEPAMEKAVMKEPMVEEQVEQEQVQHDPPEQEPVQYDSFEQELADSAEDEVLSNPFSESTTPTTPATPVDPGIWDVSCLPNFLQNLAQQTLTQDVGYQEHYLNQDDIKPEDMPTEEDNGEADSIEQFVSTSNSDIYEAPKIAEYTTPTNPTSNQDDVDKLVERSISPANTELQASEGVFDTGRKENSEEHVSGFSTEEHISTEQLPEECTEESASGYSTKELVASISVSEEVAVTVPLDEELGTDKAIPAPTLQDSHPISSASAPISENEISSPMSPSPSETSTIITVPQDEPSHFARGENDESSSLAEDYPHYGSRTPSLSAPLYISKNAYNRGKQEFAKLQLQFEEIQARMQTGTINSPDMHPYLLAAVPEIIREDFDFLQQHHRLHREILKYEFKQADQILEHKKKHVLKADMENTEEEPSTPCGPTVQESTSTSQRERNIVLAAPTESITRVQKLDTESERSDVHQILTPPSTPGVSASIVFGSSPPVSRGSTLSLETPITPPSSAFTFNFSAPNAPSFKTEQDNKDRNRRRAEARKAAKAMQTSVELKPKSVDITAAFTNAILKELAPSEANEVDDEVHDVEEIKGNDFFLDRDAVLAQLKPHGVVIGGEKLETLAGQFILDQKSKMKKKLRNTKTREQQKKKKAAEKAKKGTGGGERGAWG